MPRPNIGVDEVIEFLVEACDAQRLLDFRASEEAQERVQYLVNRSSAGALTSDERSELECAALLEHILRMAKLKARLRSSQS